jgi:Na+-translocating ferredoxin:NAD+ oxidoreductase subunit B
MSSPVSWLPPIPTEKRAVHAAEPSDLFNKVLNALPQTQCTRCGYPDCAGYARAIADGMAAINQCPPGGQQGIDRLAALTGQPAIPLNSTHGQETTRKLAVIDEKWCIGCTLCIKACPVDSILGATKKMHTVIEPHCTGCELCLPVCPVDCIELIDVTTQTGWAAWSPEEAHNARQRYTGHQERRQREADEHRDRLVAKAEVQLTDPTSISKLTDPASLDQKRIIVEAAIERARAQRQAQLSMPQNKQNTKLKPGSQN